jgi:hypothetical protein
MRLGSARRSSSVSSSFQRGHAAKITAAPMMKKVGVKLYRDLSQLFLNLKREEIFFPRRLLKGPRAPGARVCAPLFYYPSWNAQISLRVSPLKRRVVVFFFHRAHLLLLLLLLNRINNDPPLAL